MRELDKSSHATEHILRTVREEYPDSHVRYADVVNALLRGRGDDLDNVAEMIRAGVSWVLL